MLPVGAPVRAHAARMAALPVEAPVGATPPGWSALPAGAPVGAVGAMRGKIVSPLDELEGWGVGNGERGQWVEAAFRAEWRAVDPPER